MPAFALNSIAFAPSPSLHWVLVFLGAAGIVEMTLASSIHMTLTISAPESMRGQVASLLPMVPGFISVGTLCARIGAAATGVQPLVLALSLFVVVLTWTGSPSYRSLRTTGLVSRV